jgi:hypothetical protein
VSLQSSVREEEKVKEIELPKRRTDEQLRKEVRPFSFRNASFGVLHDIRGANSPAV